MAYERPRTATRLATAALLVGGCGRFGFEDHDPPVDAEPACTPAVQIAAIDGGHDFYCAQLADNSLRCWGANDIGQLGNATRTSSPTGVSPLNLPDVSTFATGHQHACAVRQGDVLCWGRNDIGQLGQGDRVGRAVPARVNGLPGDMVGVAAGGLTTCAWNTAGTLYCWGQTTGTATSPSNTPRQVVGLPPVRDIALSTSRSFFSADHVCMIGTDDTTWCWGSNNLDQLGDNTGVDSDVPVAVSGGHVFETITAGDGHSCARTSAGEVYCWGLNVDGQGSGPLNRLTVPTRVDGLTAVELDANNENTCARTANGEVFCLGDNDFRQLGRDGGDAFTPERIEIPPAAQLAVATESSCALGTDGVLRCWGTERSGVISGLFAPPTTTQIPDVSTIDAGGDNTCALTADGRVFCWGLDSLGQLGAGASQGPSSQPTQVVLPRAARSIAVGLLHTCVALDDGSMRCWGWNESRQVDQEASEIRPTVPPVGVPASSHVATGAGHTCAFSTGTIPWCWGGNSEGALGLPNGASGMVPVQSNFPAMSAMDAGRNHTCGITTAGDLFCAGRNNEHQIGDGGTSDVYTPYQVPLTQVGTVATGDRHTCAATVGPSAVYCWGEAIAGQLGLGNGVEADVPTALSLGGNVVQLVGGGGHTCARDSAGMVWCWGSNADGQLGTGSLDTVAVATAATELTGATHLAAGTRHTCGLMPNGDIRCVGNNTMGQLGGGAPVASTAPRQAALTCPR